MSVFFLTLRIICIKEKKETSSRSSQIHYYIRRYVNQKLIGLDLHTGGQHNSMPPDRSIASVKLGSAQNLLSSNHRKLLINLYFEKPSMKGSGSQAEKESVQKKKLSNHTTCHKSIMHPVARGIKLQIELTK